MLHSTIPVLPTLSLDETTAFYAKLGFRVISRYEHEGYLLIQREGHELHFFLKGDHDPKTSFFGTYWRVSDAETLHAEYAAAQVENLHPVEAKPWGMLEFAVIDPHGNLIRIGERLQ